MLKISLAAAPCTFVPVCAFLSPTNPDAAPCAHFLPRLQKVRREDEENARREIGEEVQRGGEGNARRVARD